MIQMKILSVLLLVAVAPVAFAFQRFGLRQLGTASIHQPKLHRSDGRSVTHVSVSDSVPIEDLITPEDVFTRLRETLKGTCVYFVGMMGSGKTTVGNAFAENLGYRFLDTDELAEFMCEMPISEYFEKEGETAFRDVEHKVLVEMAQYTRLIVSTGGGIVTKKENWGLLRHGVVVYLDMPVNDIYERMSANPDEVSKRPLLRSEDPLAKLQELHEKRHETYLQADVHVELSLSETPQQAARHVAQSMLDFIAQNPPMWEAWKKKRDDFAVQAAGRVNPQATASADVGFGQKKGSITEVKLSDIKSGKVKLPPNVKLPPGVELPDQPEEEDKPPAKGFGN
jgi:shikimate kinase